MVYLEGVREQRSRSRSEQVVLGMLLLVSGLFVGAAQVVMSIHQGVTCRCLVDGPSSSRAEVSERSGVAHWTRVGTC
ncbi:hypothetical protein C5E16_01650 [Clavibacter michiganensis]|uniref:Uncharacterized protein n=1 Tax=Clavibacter michiganensis TaxID=28447 RepID=A0A2S5VY49_9MICO|nr:hypothetical protein C5E16_01650 [Clavibacter michiganensis]